MDNIAGPFKIIYLLTLPKTSNGYLDGMLYTLKNQWEVNKE